MDYSAAFRIKGGRIPHIISRDAKILTEKKARFPRAGGQVFHDNLSKIDVFVKIHGIPAGQDQGHPFMVEAHLRNQRVGHIPQIQLPPRPNPGKLIIDPYT